MRLDGKVSKIERIVAAFRGGSKVDDEKRVFHLNVRLPDKSLEAAYTYGYGQMHFILHGKAMNDFVDLGGEVDIYVVPKDQGDVPQREFEDMRTNLYRLEGEVASLTAGNEHLKQRDEDTRKENGALRQRLAVAMEEVMRLEARLGLEPPATKLLEEAND